MKHLKFLAAVCCMAAVFAACEKNEPSNNATGTANGHEWVDLGLSVKWATCNVGAIKPELYGSYYAWGETEPKTIYDESTYKWYNGDYDTFTKYNTVDNKTVLDLEDDAARANWGGAWRMPTDAEWTELYENCTWTWTTLNGVKGYEVTSMTNGNSIFLPTAGCRYYDGLDGAGYYGYYWLSSLETDDLYGAWEVFLDSDNVGSNSNNRFLGLSVRPVL